MIKAQLPSPDADALQHSARLTDQIHQKITDEGGSITFAQYMEAVLYTPGLGYYSGGAKKFGQAGDFVTAPEISTLFASTLANQVTEVLNLNLGDLLELGAGTGKLACDLLMTLHKRGSLPEHYYIMEVSADLRELQQKNVAEKLPSDLAQKVVWLDRLPDSFSGVVIANEVLDALPVHLVHQAADGLMEKTVVSTGRCFAWGEQYASEPLNTIVQKLGLPTDYLTEVNLAASALMQTLAEILKKGLILMIDYGFSRREYYHPQRSQGTLMCHYRHYAHDDPFLYPGLQDITAHVDFTAVAEAAVLSELELAGYCSQAQFLVNCGITDVLAAVSPNDTAQYIPLASQAQKLLSPAEMGELFKVIAFSKGIDPLLMGFSRGDKRHTL